MKTRALVFLLAFLAGQASQAVLTISGTYDEQDVQTNAVDFSMNYSGNTTWTTGIGQTLGASQIIDLATFKPLVEAAFTNGNGGVVDFDNGSLTDDQTITVGFASGAKSLTLTNRAGNGGGYTLNAATGSRTAISGDNWLGRSGNPHFDLDIGGFTGFAANEQVTAIGVTILGRDNANPTSGWRVIARYTNGVDSGSSSTWRRLDTGSGNTTADSFSGIVAPDGYWITSVRVHSDSGVFSGIDDLGFVTSVIDNPDQAPVIVTDLPATLDAPFSSTVNLSITLDPATSPPPAWQWEIDAAPEDGTFVPVPVEDGGTNATLSFTADPAREGTYRVTATNPQGSETSAAGQFRVLPAAPVITTDLPFLLEPIEGETVTLSVTLDPATYPAPSYQWFFNQVEIPAAQGGTDPILSFVAGPATDGNYFVDVENTEGIAFSGDVDVAHLADADGDGIPDIHESGTGTYLSATDTGTDPNNPDSDGDGLLDGGDIAVPSDDPRHTAWTAAGISFVDDGGVRTFLGEAGFGTDPNLPDTDGDGLLDGGSITLTGADPRHAAWTTLGIVFEDDGGDRTFSGELSLGTDPVLADTDGDGISDGQEVLDGTNPVWFNNALEWRPGGEPGGDGSWDSTTANWFDGETSPGAATVWDSGKVGLFPQPAGTVEVAGTQQANQLVFFHTGGTYSLNAAAPGDTLAFTGADPLVRITRETRFNLPVSGSFTLQGEGNTLRLTTDNSASLAGATVRVASGQLRGYDGASGVGNELGDAATTLIVEPGGQIRYFNVTQGARNYPQTLRLAGTGAGGNPGALNNDSQTADNNITWSGDIILDADASIACQNQGTWSLGNLSDAGAGHFLALLQPANTSTISGAVELGGMEKLGNGTLVFAPAATTTLGELIVSGGTIRLNAIGQLDADTKVSLNSGTTLDINGFDQSVARLEGAGGISGGATTTVSELLYPGSGSATLDIIGSLKLAGAKWEIDAAGTDNNRVNVSGNLDLTGATLEFFPGALTEDLYVIASYGTLSGQGSVTTTGVPDGFTLVLDHDSGTRIALVKDTGGFDDWATANGIAGEPFDGDFDSDGIPNGMEYALAGLDPTLASGFPGTFENGTLSFSKRPEAVANGDVIYTIETSATLEAGSWTPVTPDVDDATTLSYQLSVGHDRIFVRLSVVGTP